MQLKAAQFNGNDAQLRQREQCTVKAVPGKEKGHGVDRTEVRRSRAEL
jgi:hypothetical protein